MSPPAKTCCVLMRNHNMSKKETIIKRIGEFIKLCQDGLEEDKYVHPEHVIDFLGKITEWLLEI